MHHVGTVEAVEQLTPTLVRIVFGGEGLDGYEPTDVPGVVNGSTSDWTASQEKLRAIWRLPHF